MMDELKELGVIGAIVKHLQTLPTNTKVLEINCGKGEFAEILKGEGIVKYAGVDPSEANIKEAQKIKGFKTKFEVADPSKFTTEETEGGEADPDSVIVVLNGEAPYKVIPSGQRLIVVTRGYATWDAACLQLSPLFQEGAGTIQHGSLFVTYGVRA